jgi:glyoxylase-like metal-dependent hydrolase (beta-lactamase superfamily II)
MQLTPNVRAVQVPDANPMHPQVTSIYLVGRGQALTIDSGEDEERYRWMLKGYLAATEHAEIGQSAVTHYHADHSSNLKWLRDQFGADVLAFRGAPQYMQDRLPDQGLRMLDDGVEVGPSDAVRLQVMHTPGHSPDSVCYYLEAEGVLFSGDTLLGSTTTTVHDLADYMASLQRLRDLPNLKLICPGHGPVIENPAQTIDDYIKHRNAREQQIVAALSTGETLTSWEIMERIYTDIDIRLRCAADGNVRSHLHKLEREGRLKTYEGVRKDPSPEAVATAQAEEHERVETLRKADQIRTDMRRRALFLQENPPSDEWLEPPRFELA